MDCMKTEEILSEYIENELTPKKKIEVELHLKECHSCSTLYKSLKNLIENGSNLSEEVPFYLKNRLLYIPEVLEPKEKPSSSNQGVKILAAMIGTIVLLINIFYFTNIYPKGHYFLRKTVSKVERFAIDTKKYLFQKDSIKNNFLVSFLDKNIFNSDKKHYLKWDGENNGNNG